MPDERKQRQLLQHGKKESTFLRLRRTKLGLDDFRTVKVIGKGAFGEVSTLSSASTGAHTLGPMRDIGPTGPEDRHRKDLCNEDVEKGGDVEEGSGMLIHTSLVVVPLILSVIACSRPCGA